MTGKYRLGLLLGTCGALAFSSPVSGAQTVARSARSVSADSLDIATHARVTALAQQILDLAKTKAPHRFYHLRGAFSTSYEVAVEVNVPGKTGSVYLENRYALYAHFARPPGSRHGLVDPRDFNKLRATNALALNINGGAQGLSFTHEALPGHVGQLALRPGWVFNAGYIDSADRFTKLSAATRPHAPRQRRLGLRELSAAAAQAGQILDLQNATSPLHFYRPPFRVSCARTTRHPISSSSCVISAAAGVVWSRPLYRRWSRRPTSHKCHSAAPAVIDEPRPGDSEIVRLGRAGWLAVVRQQELWEQREVVVPRAAFA
jgi:hypothetical protein